VVIVKPKPKNIVSHRVRQARKRRKPPLTQKQLSDRVVKLGANIDRAGIAKIELGLRSVCDFELVAIAKALRVSVGWLLSGRG
jgi:HTH-type transcriptional regulator, cell division transcriptional repressor